MTPNEAFVEAIFLNECTKIIKTNRLLGIEMNDALEERIIGLLIITADKDFYSFLKTVQIIKELGVINSGEYEDFILEKIPLALKAFDQSFRVGYKAVFVSNLLYLYGVKSLDELARERIGGAFCDELPNIRAAYASLRLVVERPQFLINRQPNQADLDLLGFLKLKLEELLSDKLPIKKKPSQKNVLFLFGHAQPLPYIGSHWRQVITYVTGFCEAYPEKKVRLVVTNEAVTTEYFKNLHALPVDWQKRLINQAIEIYGKPLPKRLDIRLYNPSKNENDLLDIVSDIGDFNPSIAFSWLGFFSADVYYKSVSKICELFSIQFQAGNKPNLYSNNIFCQGNYNNHSPNKLVRGFNYINNPIPLVPEENKGLWKEVEAPSDCFNLVTTLGNGRIERSFSSYPDSFLARWANFFEENKSVTWSFVGVSQKEAILRHDMINDLYKKNRIFFYERVDDLRSFYQLHSAYVHMPRMHGGGWGIGLAVFEKLPTLCQAGGDADNFLPQESLYVDEHVFFDKLSILIKDERVRKTLVELQSDQLVKHTPANVAKQLYEKANALNSMTS